MMAMSRPAVAMIALMFGLALSGCVGEDTPKERTATDDPDVAPEAVATDATGSITGTIVSDALEPLEAVRVALVKGEEFSAETQTTSKGLYTINEVPPGTYILQVSKPTYREAARSVQVDVRTVQTVNIELQRLSDSELGVVFADGPHSMGGFLACGAGFAVNDTTRERGASTNPCFKDPNSRNVFRFEVGEGIRTLIVGMTWKPAGGVSGEYLNLAVETNETEEIDPTTPRYTYADVTERPDIVVRIDEDDITGDEWKWSNVTGSQTIRVRVFPGMTAPPTAIYQQSFTIWWEAWYNGEAPADRNPLPDA